MKRSIILFAAVLLVLVGWSQTITINFKDGSVVNQNVSNINSFEITDTNQSDNGDNQGDDDSQGENQKIRELIVGTWHETKEEKWVMPSDISLKLTYIQFNNDGTWFSVRINEEKGFTTISKGRWHVLDNYLIVNTKEGGWTFYPTVWTIKTIESDELILTFDKATAYLTKVDDSEIERYLPSNFNRAFYCKGGYDCMENKTLTIDGKQYYASYWSTFSEIQYAYGVLHMAFNPHEEIIKWKPSTAYELSLEPRGSNFWEMKIGDIKLHDRASFGGGHDNYAVVGGSVTVLEITDYYITVRLNNLIIQKNNYKHTYDGIVILHNSILDGKTLVPLPFTKPND